MKEIWRDIKDYEGLYQVSNLGRVRSVDRYRKQKGNSVAFIKGKILKQEFKKNSEYLRVVLVKNSVYKHFSVHRLVAEAFIPNPHNYPTVDHINRIKTDNRAENLRWAPYELQAKNRIIPSQKNRKDQSKPVLQYTLDMVFVKEYPSIGEASRQTGINKANISACCKGKYGCKSAGGYIWRYKD